MNPRIKMLVVAVVALAVVALFYKGALAPKYARAAAVQAEIDKTQGLLDQARAQTKTLETAKASYSSDYTTLARLGKAVPAEDDLRSLLVQLEAAARRSNVDFRSMTLSESAPAVATAPSGSGAATQSAAATLPPGASVGTAGLPTMPFAFEFAGSYFNLSEFLARLDRFVVARGDRLDVKGRLLTVDGFSLAPSEAGFPQMTATVGATAYLANPSQGANGGATAAAPATPVEPAPAATKALNDGSARGVR